MGTGPILDQNTGRVLQNTKKAIAKQGILSSQFSTFPGIHESRNPGKTYIIVYVFGKVGSKSVSQMRFFCSCNLTVFAAAGVLIFCNLTVPAAALNVLIRNCTRGQPERSTPQQQMDAGSDARRRSRNLLRSGQFDRLENDDRGEGWSGRPMRGPMSSHYLTPTLALGWGARHHCPAPLHAALLGRTAMSSLFL